MKRDAIVVLDFGSQYTQLIARRIREQRVYCEIQPYTLPLTDIEKIAPKGIILSGGPASVYEADAPKIDAALFSLDIPVLGICYGMQLIAYLLEGGKIHPATEREYGNAQLQVNATSEPLFTGLPSEVMAWMSHGDKIDNLPDGFHTIAQTPNSPIAAMVNSDGTLYGLQFHPEVEHTRDSDKILYNFVRHICGCEATWTMDTFIAEAITDIREKVKDERVLCAVSGGIDSMVLATLLNEAIGDALVSVFVDNGLLRQNEAEQVLATCKALGLKIEFVDATESFFE